MTSIVSPPNGFSNKFLNRDLSNGKQYELVDYSDKESKLRLRISIAGKKTFIWRYVTKERKSRVYTVGVYLEKYTNAVEAGGKHITLADARDKVRELKKLHESGLLLTAKEQAVKKNAQLEAEDKLNVAVENVIAEFYNKVILSRRRPETPKQLIDAEILGKRKGFTGIVLGDLNLKDVTSQDVQELINNTIRRGKSEHAMKIMALLKQFFTWCENGGHIAHSPIHGLSRAYFGVKSAKSEHLLDIASEADGGEPAKGLPEIVNFFETLDKSKVSLQIKNGLKILLLTGVRTGELQKAKVTSIKGNNWFIPAEDTKTEQAWTVPISNFTLELFEELKGKVDKKCGLYLNCTDSKAMARAVNRLCKDNDWPKFTPHTLRKVFRTHIEYLGVPSRVAEKCLNHSLGTIESTYNKSKMLEQRREALQKWSDKVEAALKPKVNNVISIKSA